MAARRFRRTPNFGASSCVSVEYSRDRGSSWTAVIATDADIAGIRLHICVSCRRPRSAEKAPAHPVAQGFAHDQREIAALESRQFLGEHRYALPPRGGHPGDVGDPEHPIRTERVEAAM
jgi:hypothetical protein